MVSHIWPEDSTEGEKCECFRVDFAKAGRNK